MYEHIRSFHMSASIQINSTIDMQALPTFPMLYKIYISCMVRREHYTTQIYVCAQKVMQMISFPFILFRWIVHSFIVECTNELQTASLVFFCWFSIVQSLFIVVAMNLTLTMSSPFDALYVFHSSVFHFTIMRIRL